MRINNGTKFYTYKELEGADLDRLVEVIAARPIEEIEEIVGYPLEEEENIEKHLWRRFDIKHCKIWEVDRLLRVYGVDTSNYKIYTDSEGREYRYIRDLRGSTVGNIHKKMNLNLSTPLEYLEGRYMDEIFNVNIQSPMQISELYGFLLSLGIDIAIGSFGKYTYKNLTREYSSYFQTLDDAWNGLRREVERILYENSFPKGTALTVRYIQNNKDNRVLITGLDEDIEIKIESNETE